MKFPTIPNRPSIPLSNDEILIGRIFLYAEHRGDSLIPGELSATNRRLALSPPFAELARIAIFLGPLWLLGVICFASGATVLGTIVWIVGGAAFTAYQYYVTPKVVEESLLENVVLCTSENERSMFKRCNVKIVFASGASWRLRSHSRTGNPLNIPSLLRRAGLVVTEKK